MAKSNTVIERIPYAEGTFDTEIYKRIHDAVLSSSITSIFSIFFIPHLTIASAIISIFKTSSSMFSF